MNQRFSAIYRVTISLLASGIIMIAIAAAEGLPTLPKVSRSPSSNHGVPAAKPSRCTVREDSNGWWLISPAGERFFSLGICVFDQGSDRQSYDPARPSYAAWKHYDSAGAWAASNVKRLKSWGFTTIGGWSDFKTVEQTRDHGLWTTPVVSLGARSGAPWFDMWDEKVVRRINEIAEETISPLRGNPRVIGYYSDNELGWWNAILWNMTLQQPSSSGQRQRLVRVVRESYADDWTALTKDFEPRNAENWDELNRGGELWLRPGGNGIRAMRRFLGTVAERYYQVMHDAIRKVDADTLYLGDRYQSFYYPEVALGARRHVDVISTNLNASWNDGTFLSSYLDTLHNLTGKPVIISEFYMSAAENSSGNRNKVGGFPIVATQRERRDALANTLSSMARLPYVVGADWFQYYDEPPHGRKKDGEDYNFGLIDIHDRPYPEVTTAFADANLTSMKSAGSPRSSDATAGVPPAPADPLGEFQPTIALKSWNRKRGFIPPATKNPTGDLYICWSPKALYLATIVIDIAEPDYYKDGEIPDTDRSKWTIQLDDQSPMNARVGAGKKPAIDKSTVRIASLSGTYHDVRCITAIELPAAQFGKKRFSSGDRVKLTSTFDTFARAASMKWEGEFVLAE